MARVPAFMLQGTGSNVGKSLLVTGLCRAFSRRGLNVRPFKPQNMSNNAAVTPDGGEIGRAQALQARACGIGPSVHMNPVLLKPQTEIGAQVIVQGRIFATCMARDYARLKPDLMPYVLESFAQLSLDADLILAEGAGSPAEVNLREHDIANMGFAQATDLPVVLVGDIDKGGVIAALVGTHALLEPAERARLKGYLINKFRGDPLLFDDAHPIIAERTGMRGYGVVPWFDRARLLPAEDVLGLNERAAPRIARSGSQSLGSIGSRTSMTSIRYGRTGRACADRAARRAAARRCRPPHSAGLQGDARGSGGAARRGLGHRSRGACPARRRGARHLWRLADARPAHRRSGRNRGPARRGRWSGPARSRHGPDRRQAAARGPRPGDRERRTVHGYEMHVGRTSGPALARPMLDLDGRPDGAVSPDGRIMGCYVHGLFADDDFRPAFLAA